MRAEVTFADIARELNLKVWGWIAYYGRYTRSALYPMARHIDQTQPFCFSGNTSTSTGLWATRASSLRRSHVRTEDSFVHWQLGDGGELA
jgi:RNA-directed DNA polymerase